MVHFACIFSGSELDEQPLRDAMGASRSASGVALQTHRFADLKACVAVAGTAEEVELLWSENRDLCLCWRGELFPAASEFAALSKKPRGEKLGAWILALYEKEGPEGFIKLNGWFSGVILDLTRRTATVFNDRYGLGRIYFCEAEGSFAFASEAKILLSLRPALRSLDPRALGEWLSCGCVLQNRTLFSGVHLMPPASSWSFQQGHLPNRASYFDVDSWANQSPITSASYQEKLEEVFPAALKRYLPPDSTAAMSLTGGLDGRMIMAWAKRAPGTLPCYSFNGPYRDCADTKLARRIAAHCRQSHQAIPVTAEFFKEFPALAAQSVRLSDGAMDVTGAAEVFMNRIAARVAPVRLTGNYGSEIIRRHVAFRPGGVQSGLFAQEVIESTSQAGETYRSERGSNSLQFIVKSQLPWHHFARFSVEQSQLRVRSPYLDNELVQLAFQAPPESASAIEPSLRLIAAGDPELARIPTDRGVTWPARGWSNRLTREYHEFWAKAEYAYDYGMPQWIARLDHVFSPFRFERIFLGRQKFCHFRSWYRDELSTFVRETLLSSKALSRPYLDAAGVKRAVESHLKGVANHTTAIHKLLSLELLHETLLSGRN